MSCRTSRVSGPTYGEKQWGQFTIDSGCNEGWLTWTNCCPLQCLPPHPLVIPTPSTSSKNHQKSYILLMYAVHLGYPRRSLLNETCTGLWNDSLQYSTYATLITVSAVDRTWLLSLVKQNTVKAIKKLCSMNRIVNLSTFLVLRLILKYTLC